MDKSWRLDGGAGLDRFGGEQLARGHLLVAVPRVVLTPHLGSAVCNNEVRPAAMLADDIERIGAGREVLYSLGGRAAP